MFLITLYFCIYAYLEYEFIRLFDITVSLLSCVQIVLIIPNIWFERSEVVIVIGLCAVFKIICKIVISIIKLLFISF